MSWFKKSINWQGQEMYHLENVMRFDIDTFPRLSLGREGSVSSNIIGFNIQRDDGKMYSLSFRRNNGKIDSLIRESERIVHSKRYDISMTDPKQVIEESLVTINNDLSEEFENELV